ncbi:MAG: Rhs element Vgr protein, partial [Burkholderiaceae bacterium]|nr:Rhs element Vgr protein [Burkholderiaceae bacterium]
MSAPSPLLDAEGPLRISVSCAGKAQQDLALISLSVRHALNALPWARLVLADGDMAKNESPLSDGELFKPGTAIQISCGYGDQEASIFSGIVVRHGLKISSSNDCRLVVECRDAACKMSLDRRSANYVEQSDADILQSLISNAGLQADVSSSAITHKEIVQYHCSDWDFMLARADALGWLVNVQAGKVKVAAPDTSSAPVLCLTWGQDLMELDADIDARRQWSAVQCSAWDPKAQALVQSDDAKPQ